MPGRLAMAIELGFDPTFKIGEAVVRWQAIGVAVAVMVALVLAAVRARREAGPDGQLGQLEPLRLDDLLYVALGILPGAVAGGRLVHALVYWDGYAADPAVLLDPAKGGLSLLGAVFGGTITALYVARLLEGTARRWADAAAVPLLVAVAIGKVAQFLAGGGQGEAWDGPWAVAFVGPGPWVSASPGVPAHPVALYEAIWALLGIGFVAVAAGGVRRASSVGTGSAFVAALSWFLLGRVLLGAFWRDDRLVGPLNVEQALAAVGLGVLVAGVAIAAWRGRRRRADVDRMAALHSGRVITDVPPQGGGTAG